jgi:HK97 gp10 family phage protein
MSNVSLSVKGLKETIKALETLEPKLHRKVVRTALRDGAKIVLAEAKATAPVKTGALKKSLKVKAGKKKRHGQSISVRTDKTQFPDQYYSAFQEFGTSKMPAQHMMEKAGDAKEQQVRETIIKQLDDGIQRIWSEAK